MEPALEEVYWRKMARRLRLRVNMGWWGMYMVPLLAGGCVVAGFAIIPVRRWELLSAFAGWWVIPVVLLVAGTGVAYGLARRHFVSEAQALARLDAGCHLHNRLSAASQGVGSWPLPPSAPLQLPAWNLWRTLVPLVCGGAALLLAALLPLQAGSSTAALPPSHELSSWTAVDASLERMQQEELVQREALARVRQQLESLRAQPRENWYRPGSMEASDHLREQVGQSARDLQQALNQASAALAAATDGRLSDRQRDALLEQLGQALETMRQGMLPLDAETLAALAELASQEGLKGVTLDPEALKKLLEQLQQGSQSFGECASLCRVEGSCTSGSCTNGQCRAEGSMMAAAVCQSSEGGDDAAGGISRDAPGNTPLTFRAPTAPLLAGSPESLANRDLRQAALGDTVGLSTDEHEVDRESWSGTGAGGGAAAHLGQGGEAVWRQTVMPQEQAVLKAYFE